jgi:8-hydroxy-5-deazaflavin:NADPH oxidoreductase
MRYGVLGTGVVGSTLAGKLVALGHEVMMGARSAGNEKAVEWARSAGERASQGSFADAAGFGEVVLNATSGLHSLAALRAAGADSLRGKLLIDVANPIAVGTGFPPQLSVCNDDSLAEQIQREFPDARVVKTLNTVNCDVMVNPGMVPGEHTVFVCGNDAAAKAQVVEMLGEFGWPGGRVCDLGGVDGARGTEMYLALWLRLMRATGSAHLNVEVHREG